MAREKMWFGTVEYMNWIEPPLHGADSSPQGWSESGVLLNGGGFSNNSFNSHKVYNYAWSAGSTRQLAQLMKSYADGSFGRGKLYFIEPNIYETNVLPARWADPSMTCDYEGPSLIPGVNPARVPASNTDALRLPVAAASYTLGSGTPYITAGSDVPNVVNASNACFIPIPDGYALHVGAFYSGPTNSSILVVPALRGGTAGTRIVTLDKLTSDATNILPNVFTKQPGEIGVYFWMGKRNNVPGQLTVNAIHARLAPIGEPAPGDRMWIGGQGHNGTRITGKPTYITHNRINGGQVEFAATFTETQN